MDGLVQVLVCLLIICFAHWAAKKLNLLVQDNRGLDICSLLKLAFLTSIVSVGSNYPHPNPNFLTGIMFAAFFPILSKFWKQKRYAEVLGVVTSLTAITWYLLYPIDLLGKEICLILLLLSIWIMRYGILINYLAKFIEPDRQKK